VGGDAGNMADWRSTPDRGGPVGSKVPYNSTVKCPCPSYPEQHIRKTTSLEEEWVKRGVILVTGGSVLLDVPYQFKQFLLLSQGLLAHVTFPFPVPVSQGNSHNHSAGLSPTPLVLGVSPQIKQCHAAVDTQISSGYVANYVSPGDV
jgi:hypothetical protein